jgi:hypothetical protein
MVQIFHEIKPDPDSLQGKFPIRIHNAAYKLSFFCETLQPEFSFVLWTRRVVRFLD